MVSLDKQLVDYNLPNSSARPILTVRVGHGHRRQQQQPRRCDRCVKKFCSHRVIWFLILLPIYLVLLVVTALVSMPTQTEDGTVKSFADIFFGFVYFFLLTSSLLLILRYVCHNCDKRSVCTCPRNVIYTPHDGQLLNYPKKSVPISAPIPPNPLIRQFEVNLDGDTFEQSNIMYRDSDRHVRYV